MFLSFRHIEWYATLHTYRCVKLPLDLDLRSNFEVDLARISPASASVSPFPMWFDAWGIPGQIDQRLTRAPLGGGAISSPPSRFLAISSKPMQVSPPNLQYLLSQHFYTLFKNFKVQSIIVRPQMTSEWRHVPPISTENKGLRESTPRVQFESYNQFSYMKWRRISGATKLLSRILKILKIPQNFQNFRQFFFLFQNFPPQNQNFQKNGQYVRGQWLMNMCTKFQVDILKNGWDIT